MCIFSIKFSKLNVLVSLKKNDWPQNSPDLNPLIIVWGAMLGRCQKLMPKPPSIAELQTALLSIWNDLPLEFTDKAILSFRKRLWFSCVVVAFSLNTKGAADIHHWNVWIVNKKLCKVRFVIAEYLGCNCMFTATGTVVGRQQCVVRAGQHMMVVAPLC